MRPPWRLVCLALCLGGCQAPQRSIVRRAWGSLWVVLLAGAPALAQPPGLPAPPEAPPAAAVAAPVVGPLGLPGEAADPPAAAPGRGLQHFADAKVLLGAPTGVLVQVALDRQAGRTWLAEAFAGYELFNPAFGLGGRVRFAPAAAASGDALVVGPGLDGLFFLGDHSRGEHWFTGGRDGYLLLPNVEVAWLHDWAGHFGWQLGLDVGVGAGFWAGGGGSSVTVVPLLSAFTGFSF